MSSNTTYLISGTTRGIGRGLVSSLLLRPNTTIFAGVRDLSADAAQSLLSLPKSTTSTIDLIHLDASSPTSAHLAITTLQQDHNLTHLDIVIANAGIMSSDLHPTSTTTLDSITTHLATNTYGPITLFQATLPLLLKSKSPTPKFIATSSVIGSITLAPSIPVPTVAYGLSKAALNWFFSRANGEWGEKIGFVLMHPGLVETEISEGFRKYGNGEERIKAISVEESVKGYLDVVDRAEKGGKLFVQWDGEGMPW